MKTKTDDVVNGTSYYHTRMGLRRRKGLLWLIVVGIAILVVLMNFNKSVWFPWLYELLDVSQPPQEADYVVVLVGGNGTRELTALDLYNQGYASHMLLCSCDRYLEQTLQEMSRGGVASNDIIIMDVRVGSTWEEAEAVLTLLRQEGVDSALIVTDGYHTRRARATYRQLQSRPRIKLTFVATSGPYLADSWWEISSGRYVMRNEYIKTVYYLFRYGVFPW
jgi:uncharacterized SAM-binding protein YcdF (DUF218 family)